MRKLYIIPLLLFVIGLCASCSKSADSDISAEPVVIGYLNGNRPMSVKVYQQRDLSDTATYGPLISGLKLTITDGTKTVALAETATGTYTSADSTFLVAKKTYTLNFTYNGAMVSASTVMPTKPTNYTSTQTTLQVPRANTLNNNIALILNWDNPDSLYHVVVFKNDEVAPFNARLQYNAPVNFTLQPNKNSAYDVYYQSLSYLGTYRMILYRVNKEYIDLLNTTTSTTSKNLNNPPTNVVNGLGIFTAMQSDTIKLVLY